MLAFLFEVSEKYSLGCTQYFVVRATVNWSWTRTRNSTSRQTSSWVLPAWLKCRGVHPTWLVPQKRKCPFLICPRF